MKKEERRENHQMFGKMIEKFQEKLQIRQNGSEKQLEATRQ